MPRSDDSGNYLDAAKDLRGGVDGDDVRRRIGHAADDHRQADGIRTGRSGRQDRREAVCGRGEGIDRRGSRRIRPDGRAVRGDGGQHGIAARIDVLDGEVDDVAYGDGSAHGVGSWFEDVDVASPVVTMTASAHPYHQRETRTMMVERPRKAGHGSPYITLCDGYSVPIVNCCNGNTDGNHRSEYAV